MTTVRNMKTASLLLAWQREDPERERHCQATRRRTTRSGRESVSTHDGQVSGCEGKTTCALEQRGSERVPREHMFFNKASRWAFASSNRTRRWTCLVWPAQAREGAKRLRQQEEDSTRHADRSINASMSASRNAHRL